MADDKVGQNTASRRAFLQSTAAAAAFSPYIFTTRSARAQEAPSDRIVYGSIGVGGQGTHVMNLASRHGSLAAIADLDARHLRRARRRMSRRQEEEDQADAARSAPDGYEDYRRILDRDDIDVVTIGTPDHWHAKIAIEAMQAGKDVYCEKPLTLTIDEGKAIIKALEETGRVFQVGTQQRSSRQFVLAVALARAGRLGDVKKVTVGIDRAPYSESIPTSEPPAELNWERWLGQCPLVDYRYGPGAKQWTGPRSGGDGGENASNCHYEFRWWYDYSGGKLTDWGAHHIDICQWILDQNGPGQGPRKITPVMVEHPVAFDENGDPKQRDRYNVATKYEFLVEFPDDVQVTVSSEARNGLLVEGTEGRMFVNRGTIEGLPIEQLVDNPFPDDEVDKVRGGPRPWDHMEDFFRCVRDRRNPVSDVWSHHRAVTTGHLCAIAGRLNRAVEWDPQSQMIQNDPVARAMQSREQRQGYEIPT